LTRLLLDTSVLIKWCHAEGESELDSARALRSGHVSGEVIAHVIDLAPYELGNVLVRALGWSPEETADQLDDLYAIVGPPIVMSPAMLRRAAGLAVARRLSFYDAGWAAAALELGVSLVSADRRLLAAGLAEAPTQACARLRLD
jgi:predicted nucleic acid-binding protein